MFVKIVGDPKLLDRLPPAGKDKNGAVSWSVNNTAILDDPEAPDNQIDRLASQDTFNLPGGVWAQRPLIFLAVDGKKVPGAAPFDLSKPPKANGLKMGAQVWIEEAPPAPAGARKEAKQGSKPPQGDGSEGAAKKEKHVSVQSPTDPEAKKKDSTPLPAAPAPPSFPKKKAGPPPNPTGPPPNPTGPPPNPTGPAKDAPPAAAPAASRTPPTAPLASAAPTPSRAPAAAPTPAAAPPAAPAAPAADPALLQQLAAALQPRPAAPGASVEELRAALLASPPVSPSAADARTLASGDVAALMGRLQCVEQELRAERARSEREREDWSRRQRAEYDDWMQMQRREDERRRETREREERLEQELRRREQELERRENAIRAREERVREEARRAESASLAAAARARSAQSSPLPPQVMMHSSPPPPPQQGDAATGAEIARLRDENARLRGDLSRLESDVAMLCSQRLPSRDPAGGGLGERVRRRAQSEVPPRFAAVLAALEAVGLQRMFPVFLEQDVDAQALRHASDADLVELGISDPVARRRLLDEAVRVLLPAGEDRRHPSPARSAGAAPFPTPSTPPPGDEGMTSFHRATLTSFFRRTDPAKVPQVPELLARGPSALPALYDGLLRAYGIERSPYADRVREVCIRLQPGWAPAAALLCELWKHREAELLEHLTRGRATDAHDPAAAATWQEVEDPSRGHVYYFSQLAQASQWARPAALQYTAPVLGPASAAPPPWSVASGCSAVHPPPPATAHLSAGPPPQGAPWGSGPLR